MLKLIILKIYVKAILIFYTSFFIAIKIFIIYDQQIMTIYKEQ